MTNHSIVTPDGDIVAEARANAMQILGYSAPFQNMTYADQERIYRHTVDREIARLSGDAADLSGQQGLSAQMATDSGEQMGFKGYNPGFTGSTHSMPAVMASRPLRNPSRSIATVLTSESTGALTSSNMPSVTPTSTAATSARRSPNPSRR